MVCILARLYHIHFASCVAGCTLGAQVWASAGKIAEAYQVGKVEPTAAFNLFQQVDVEVSDKLAALVS